MPKRFYVPGPLTAGARQLGGSEAHHLLHVLRLGVGQSVILFDGQGFEASADVTAIANGGVDLHVVDVRPTETEPAVDVILAAAVPKGDRFGWLIEKATELGIRRFVPLVTERSVVIPGEGKLEKMRRTIVEASKQCGRSRLMELDLPLRWAEFVEQEFADSPAGTLGWVAHPTGEPYEPATFPPAGQIILAVGPEGGFTDAEVELATQSGAKLLSLGPRVLRIETAAVALAALATCASRNVG